MIGIISDTHENEAAVRKAVSIFKNMKVEFVVHCGDIISPPTLENYKGLNMKFVLGNNDGEEEGLSMMSRKLGWEPVKEEMEFEYKGKKFYVYHGTNKSWLDSKIKENVYDYILTGHTHVKRNDKVGRTRVINPGALFRANPYTVAVLDLDKDKVSYVEIK